MEPPAGEPAAEWVTLSELKPWAKNPRVNAATRPKLAESIIRFGFGAPLVARKANREILAGHTRIAAALLLPVWWKKASAEERVRWSKDAEALATAKRPVLPVRFLDLDEHEAHAYALADNKIPESSAWDDGLLAEVTRGLALADVSLDGLGFGDAELSALLGDLNPPPATTRPASGPPAPTEPPGAPKSERGTLYELGPHRLYCGDSTVKEDVDALMGGEKAAAVFCDPPYAIYGSSTGLSQSITDDKIVRPFFRDVLLSAERATKLWAHIYVCCDWRSWPSWWEMAKQTRLAAKNKLVWDKGGGGMGNNFANSYEEIGFFANWPVQKVMSSKRETGARQVLHSNVLRDTFGPGDDGPDRTEALIEPPAGDDAAGERTGPLKGTLRYGRVAGKKRMHNAAKPIPLVQELLRVSSDEGDLVLDLFGGSGTVLMACAEIGRRCNTMEVEPAWADVIRIRWTGWAKANNLDPGTGALDAP